MCKLGAYYVCHTNPCDIVFIAFFEREVTLGVGLIAHVSELRNFINKITHSLLLHQFDNTIARAKRKVTLCILLRYSKCIA